MTKRELIAQLSELPDDSEVIVLTSSLDDDGDQANFAPYEIDSAHIDSNMPNGAVGVIQIVVK